MSVLKNLWNKAAESIEAVKRERKYKNLQLQGEIDIAQSVKEVQDKEDELEKMILKQRDSEKPSFKDICDASEELEVAKKRHEMRVKSFKDFFGEDPRYV